MPTQSPTIFERANEEYLDGYAIGLRGITDRRKANLYSFNGPLQSETSLLTMAYWTGVKEGLADHDAITITEV